MWVCRRAFFADERVSYRLNIFGFPNAEALERDQQNLGLMDQRFA